MDKALRSRIQFDQINLNTALPNVGLFDVIFLRNVMIYFNAETKRRSGGAACWGNSKPGGYFIIISHSEPARGDRSAAHGQTFHLSQARTLSRPGRDRAP